jgi:excisionase family DNA binding protein
MRSPHHTADRSDRQHSPQGREGRQHVDPEARRRLSLDEHNDRLLTVDEIAFVLRMHPVSIRRLALAGKIPSLKISRSVRFRLADVLASMESRGRSDDE